MFMGLILNIGLVSISLLGWDYSIQQTTSFVIFFFFYKVNYLNGFCSLSGNTDLVIVVYFFLILPLWIVTVTDPVLHLIKKIWIFKRFGSDFNIKDKRKTKPNISVSSFIKKHIVICCFGSIFIFIFIVMYRLFCFSIHSLG